MKPRINIATICGSVRPGNYTAKALALVAEELGKQPKVQVNPIDLDTFDLPFPGKPARDSSVERLRQIVRQATGVVIATPEYHGSFSSVIKLAIENLGFPSPLAAKPIVLLGVAGGQIGAIKSLEYLRSVCSHVGAIVLPNLVSVARVKEVFDEQGRCLDGRTEKLIRNLAASLLDYIEDAICPRIALEAIARGEAEANEIL